VHVGKAEQEKAELTEAHAVELGGMKEELDRETQDYMDYRLNVRRCLRGLHEVVASSFREVKARCLPFPTWNAKVEELIDWASWEVKIMPDTMWQLSDYFVVLAIEGVLNMLNDVGCQELSHPRWLAASSDASVM
jgi:hypothetical protein